MSNSVIITQTTKKNLKGSTFICGLPGVGLVGNIAANFLINNLKLEQIGIIDGDNFPSISVVKDGIPNHPMRLYAGEQVCNNGKCNQLVICVSDFVPPTSITKDLVKCIFDWAKDNGCISFITGEGFSTASSDGEKDSIVYGITSTEASKDWIGDAEVTPFEFGTIGGFTGVMLNEGRLRSINVLGLLAEVEEDIPDAKAASKVIEAIDKLLLEIDLDPKPLLEEAALLEKELQKVTKEVPTDNSNSIPRYIG
tara:strand:+ start:546 stop:1304 length:759 start_codon:yes stop_codon:yes gene_type:complete